MNFTFPDLKYGDMLYRPRPSLRGSLNNRNEWRPLPMQTAEATPGRQWTVAVHRISWRRAETGGQMRGQMGHQTRDQTGHQMGVQTVLLLQE